MSNLREGPHQNSDWLASDETQVMNSNSTSGVQDPQKLKEVTSHHLYLRSCEHPQERIHGFPILGRNSMGVANVQVCQIVQETAWKRAILVSIWRIPSSPPPRSANNPILVLLLISLSNIYQNLAPLNWKLCINRIAIQKSCDNVDRTVCACVWETIHLLIALMFCRMKKQKLWRSIVYSGRYATLFPLHFGSQDNLALKLELWNISCNLELRSHSASKIVLIWAKMFR